MKIVMKMFIFTILAFGSVVFAGRPPERQDSLDHILGDFIDRPVDFTDDYLKHGGDSLDGLLDQVRGGELVEEQRHRGDSLDDLLSSQSVRRHKKEDLPLLEKTYRDLIVRREALASEKSNLERECKESDCGICCEIDDLAAQIENMTVAIQRMKSTIVHLNKLQNR